MCGICALLVVEEQILERVVLVDTDQMLPTIMRLSSDRIQSLLGLEEADQLHLTTEPMAITLYLTPSRQLAGGVAGFHRTPVITAALVVVAAPIQEAVVQALQAKEIMVVLLLQVSRRVVVVAVLAQ